MILKNFGIKDIIVYDSCGPIYNGRTERMNPYKQKLAEVTNKKNIKGDLMEGFKGRDIFVGVAQPKMVSKEMISVMAKEPLVFPLSNPIGEIVMMPWMQVPRLQLMAGRLIMPLRILACSEVLLMLKPKI